MVSYFSSVLLIASTAAATRRAHHFVYSHAPEVLEMVTKHKAGVQSISLGCKCHASSWEQKAKTNASASWCEELDECREFLPKLKNLDIKILLNVNLGKNKYAKAFLEDAVAFSESLKVMMAEFGTDGFSFDLESGGTSNLGDDYASFLETVSEKVGATQELLITGGHHTAMTHDIATLTSHADWFSMDTYIFGGQAKWQKLVTNQFDQAKANGHGDRYIPGISAGAGGTDTHWDPDNLRSALSALDNLGISRVGVFGAAIPDLPANRSFYWELIESWVSGTGADQETRVV